MVGKRLSGIQRNGSLRHLADLTWQEARETLLPETVVLLPIGAIEAHGPHLPLNTDVIIAAQLAFRAGNCLAEQGTCVVIAPPVCYGVSYVGSCFPGTIPAPREIVTGLVACVLTELARWGPRRLVVVHAHLEPAHVDALSAAVALAAQTSGAAVAFPDKREPRWATTLSEEFQRGARHAGAYETSLMFAVQPEAVRTELLPNLSPVDVDLPARLKAGARTFAEAGGKDGYFGNPAMASVAEGERLFAALVTMVVTAVGELGDWRALPVVAPESIDTS